MIPITLTVLTCLCALGVLFIGIGENRPLDAHDVLARRWAVLSTAALAAAFAVLLVAHDIAAQALGGAS